MPRYRIGIDIGGTFTDFCVLDEHGGEVFNAKVLSTPADLTQGVMRALDDFFGVERSPGDVSFLFHATTVAANALLERKGAKTWLLITEGFTGVYETPELGEVRSGSYDYLAYPKPPMLVAQRETIQIPERMDFRGNIIRPLDEDETRRRLARLRGSGVESVAVCLLFSFMNSAHEQRVRELASEIVPDVQVYLSCETLPQIREYPRLTTTVVNAYVAPVVNRYIHRLEEALKSRRISRPLYIMPSNGGSLTGSALRNIPVRMIESGPAAGVLGAAYIGRMTDQLKVISFDMGGTTAKAGIIEEGEPRIVPRFQAGEWLVTTPSLDLVEIGAGGGSIAWIDKSGLLKVGPQSAGADPGPACYPKGGTLPTVTDADVALGWLNPDFFVGGKFHLNTAAATKAISSHIAEPLKLELIEAANGIIKIVNSELIMLALAFVAHAQQTEIIAGGELEYQRNCVICHGIDGRGDGIMRKYLNISPANLRQLARKNGGKFPFWEVYRKIDGQTEVRAHGTREMPIWGDRFRAEAGSDGKSAITQAAGRILGLTFYLEHIQE